MANATWKKFEQSKAFRRAKLFARRIIGRELWLRPHVSVNLQTYDDWSFCPDLLTADHVVYSLGVGDAIGFDIALIRAQNVEIHAFDPTPSTLDWISKQVTPEKFHFHPWAVAKQDGKLFLYPRVKRHGTKSEVMYTVMEEESVRENRIEVPALSLGSIMKRLDHDYIDLLKIDIEGAEYEVIDGLLESSIRPTQILVEFHHRFLGICKAQTSDAIKSLYAAGYRIASVSVTGREVSFVKLAALALSNHKQ